MEVKIEKRIVKVLTPWLTYDSPRWMRKIEYYIRTLIFRQPKYLIDKWTVEATENDEYSAMHSLDLEKELIEAITKEISGTKDSDFIFPYQPFNTTTYSGMQIYEKVSELTEGGYYWWLSPNLMEQTNVEKNWRIVAWHPNTAIKPTDGLFIGPIKAPTEMVYKK